MAQIVSAFWKRKTLEQMDRQEWESLCDGCGLCCLQKLEDEDDASAIYYTRVACKLLDLNTCRCSDYANRRRHVPDCVQLTPAMAEEFAWLPPTCAYRLVAEGEDLPPWHHLVCGDPQAVHKVGISQAGRMLAEDSVANEDWEEHIIFRV
ncbi:YcgN family cysteine cluster protein [Halopseudomonas xiamenensis]|uniref:YcgN family cysteine cluster protein n=1 Tax=Halopseudomonas xiamenensis TaxID=157792 RepID=UPI0016265521|nr:YcgN family cysteine cluster protein [Halopseudomonas xiamenensis]